MTTELVKAQITDAEERLRQAMLASDVSALDELLSPDIAIASHLGQLLSKEDDLNAHKSGAIAIHKLIPSEQKIQVWGETAVVSVRMEMSGLYNGNPSAGDFRFTRVWARSSGETWQVVAAHISAVV